MSGPLETPPATATATAGRAPVRVRRPLNLARSGPWFAGLLLVALVAFWPTYLSRMGASDAYTHLHAATATLWILMLVVQPALILRRRRDLHRALGRASWVLAPLLVLSVLLLAHHNIQGREGQAYLTQTYVLYLQMSLVTLFAALWIAAMLKRRDRAIHARFMIATSFTLIDPVAVRLVFQVDAARSINPQWITFGLTDLLIVTLIFLERDARRGRWVFPALLAVFVLAQLPALLGVTYTAPWQAFAGWFAGLPLT